MKQVLYIILITVFGASQCFSQNKIRKTVVDASSKLPIPLSNVVLIGDRLQGTVTNEDGIFVIKSFNSIDSLEVSHIGYNKVKFSSLFKGDTIYLRESITLMDEVIVEGLSADYVIDQVIANLEINHSVEPITYTAFVRITEYPQDTSVLHILEEHIVNVYEKKDDKPKFKVLKTRVKSFSDEGKKRIKDMRLINLISIDEDNIFRYKADFLKTQKTKKFIYAFIEHEEASDSSLYTIECKLKSDTSYVLAKLFICKTTFAITKFIKYYKNDIGSYDFTDVSFKLYDDKWYLSNSYRHYKNNMYQKFYNGKGNHYTDRVCIYNLSSQPTDFKDFKGFVNIIAEPIKRYTGDFDDEFWENSNYLPLPNWIRERMR